MHRWRSFGRFFRWWLLACWLVGCQTGLSVEVPVGPTAVLAPVQTMATSQSSPTLTASPLPHAVAVAEITPTPTTTAVLAIATVEPPQLPAFSPAEWTNEEGPMRQLDASTGVWVFERPVMMHPVAALVHEDTLYVVDNGRVLQIPYATPEMAELLLAPGDTVDALPVQEPLDMALAPDGLLILDRSGDVYHYLWTTQQWSLDWYGRQLETSDGHYYMAIAAEQSERLLLETSYRYVQRYGDRPRLWLWPEPLLGVDVARQAGAAFLLLQAMDSDSGVLIRYVDTWQDPAFNPAVELERVRQIVVSETAVFVLDQGGDRIVQLDNQTGELVHFLQPPAPVRSIALNEQGGLVLLGSNWVSWPNEAALANRWVDTTRLTASIDPLAIPWPQMVMPIAGSPLSERPLQYPGAPRHYRMGIHEGLDFYWRRGTAVQAVADGIIRRIVQLEETPSADAFALREVEIQQQRLSPPELLDFYRGQQVWIEHQNGVITRYAHLSEINPELKVGQVITQGQPVGAVGNSGSPLSVESVNKDAHLHFEIWQEEQFLGKYIRPVEAYEQIRMLFDIRGP